MSGITAAIALAASDPRRAVASVSPAPTEPEESISFQQVLIASDLKASIR